MEAPPSGHRSEAGMNPASKVTAADHQQRVSAMKQAAPQSPRRQLPESGLKVSWRSPTPIREEAPPMVTTQSQSQTPAAREFHNGNAKRNFDKNTPKVNLWRPWSDQNRQKGKGKGKSKSGKKGKAKGKTKSK